MSARKIDPSQALPRARAVSRETRLALSTRSVHLRKSGIEFRSPTPLDPWVEMTVELESPQTNRKVECAGIVVSCTGNRHGGYIVSMVFTGMTPQSEAQLRLLARS